MGYLAQRGPSRLRKWLLRQTDYFSEGVCILNKLLAFVGTDLDTKVNVFSYDPSTKKYTVDRKLLNKSYQAVKDPVNNGQYCPSDLKAIKLVEDACTKYAATKFDGLAGKDGGSHPLDLSV